MSNVLVEAGLEPTPERQLVSYEGMRELIEKFVEGELYTPIPLEELIEEKVVERSDSGRVIGIMPGYELRYAELSYWHSGLIGKVEPRHLVSALRSGYDNIMERLRDEQPQAQWEAVAAHLRQEGMQRSFDSRRALEMPDFPDAGLLSQLADSSGTGLAPPPKPRRQVDLRADRRTLVSFVFADVAKSDIVDPLAERWPGRHGPMQKYVETRQIRHMSRRLREDREKCIDLIKRVIDHRARLEAAEEQEQAVVSEPQPKQLTPEAIAHMTALRQEGQQWGAIGKIFGIPHQTVRKVVLEQAGGDPALDEIAEA